MPADTGIGSPLTIKSRRFSTGGFLCAGALSFLVLFYPLHGYGADRFIWKETWVKAFRELALREGSIARKYDPDPGRLVRWKKKNLKIGAVGATVHGNPQEILSLYQTLGSNLNISFELLHEDVRVDLSPADQQSADITFVYVNDPKEFGYYMRYVRPASSSESEHSHFLRSMNKKGACVWKLKINDMVIERAVLIIAGALTERGDNACSEVMVMGSLGVLGTKSLDVKSVMDIQENYAQHFGITDLDQAMIQLLYDDRLKPGDYWADIRPYIELSTTN